MALFDSERDDNQDYRIGALERHVRALTERMDMTRVDVAKARLEMLRVKAAVDAKIDESSLDPAVVRMNEMIGEIRTRADAAAKAANEAWDELQDEVADSIDTLMKELDGAVELDDESDRG